MMLGASSIRPRLADLLDHMLRRLHGAFLPSRQLRNLVANDVETTIGREQSSCKPSHDRRCLDPSWPNRRPRSECSAMRSKSLCLTARSACPQTRMKFDRALARLHDPVGRFHVAEPDRVLIIVVDARERSVFSEVVIRRIPHLRDRIVCIADAAVDLVLVVFPEALVSLPAKFARWIVNTRCDRFGKIVCKVVFDLAEYRQRNVADAVIGVDVTAPAGLSIADGDRYSIRARVDVQYFSVVLNEPTDFAYEAIDDLVHAADWLEECRLPLVFKRLVEAVLPELRAEKFF